MTTISGNEGNDLYSDLYRQFQSYLKTKMELGSFESTQKETGRQQALTKVKISVSNTASEEPNWPKIVFMGIGLSVAYLGENISNISPHELTSREGKSEKILRLGGPPWQQDDQFRSLTETRYNRIVGQDFPDATSNEGIHGKMLFPGQSVTFEIDVPTQTIPYLQFRVEGTVSRRHLLHYQETLVMPEALVKPLAIAALRAFNDIDTHGVLSLVTASMPDFSSDTRLAEIQAFSTALTTGMTGIKTTQEALKKKWYEHKMSWFHAHIRAAYICLDRVSAALVRMREAIASSIPDRIVAESNAILALKGEAAQLNRTTEDLMHKYNISDEQVNYRYRGR